MVSGSSTSPSGSRHDLAKSAGCDAVDVALRHGRQGQQTSTLSPVHRDDTQIGTHNAVINNTSLVAPPSPPVMERSCPEPAAWPQRSDQRVSLSLPVSSSSSTCANVVTRENVMFDTSLLACIESDMCQKAFLRLIQDFLPSWNEIDPATFKAIKLSGALSNCVLKCEATMVTQSASNDTMNDDTQAVKRVLLRLYGSGTKDLFDRAKELHWLQCLSAQGIGPALLGRFGNGRLEEFILSRTLTANDMREPTMSRRIAQQLAFIHTSMTEDETTPGSAHREVLLWDRMRSWLGQAVHAVGITAAVSPSLQKRLAALNLGQYWQELETLRARLECLQSPISFCHNDLQYGNIMQRHNASRREDEMVIVDWEYAGYNYVAYDIANHFCEWAGDYHDDVAGTHVMHQERYPTRDEQRNFLRAYRRMAATTADAESTSTTAQHPYVHARRVSGMDPFHSSTESLQNLSENASETKQLEDLMHHISLFTLCSHLTWAFWGVVMAVSSVMPMEESGPDAAQGFDYIGYAEGRLRWYQKDKNRLTDSCPKT